MLRRFVAASAVASVLIAIAALILLVVPGFTIQRFAPVLLVWCCAPFVWGLWLMMAPASIVPEKLPAWGAILGVVAAVMAAFVLDMPARVFGTSFPAVYRWVAVIVMVIFYFLLWMIVRTVYRNLAAETPHVR